MPSTTHIWVSTMRNKTYLLFIFLFLLVVILIGYKFVFSAWWIREWGEQSHVSVCRTDNYHDCNYYWMWGGKPYLKLYASQSTGSVVSAPSTRYASNCVNLKGSEDGVCELEEYYSSISVKWYFPVQSKNYSVNYVKIRVLCTGFSRYLSLYAYNSNTRKWDFITYLGDMCDYKKTLPGYYFDKASKSVKLRASGRGRLYEIFVPEIQIVDYDEHPWSYEKSTVYYDNTTDKIYLTLTVPSIHVYPKGSGAYENHYSSADVYVCNGTRLNGDKLENCIYLKRIDPEDFSCAVGDGGYSTTGDWGACKFKDSFSRPKEIIGTSTLCLSPYDVDYPYCAEPFVFDVANYPKPQPPSPLNSIISFFNSFMQSLINILKNIME